MKLRTRKPVVTDPVPEANPAPAAAPTVPTEVATPTPPSRSGGGFFGRLLGNLAQPFQGPTVTVSLEGSFLRAVRCQGTRVVTWGKRDWQEYLSRENGDPVSPQEAQTDALRDLLREVGGRRSRVVADLPHFASLLRQVEIPDLERKYIGPMIVSEVLDTVPLFEHEADIAWRLRQDGGRQHAFAVVVPRQTSDAQLESFQAAGVRPAATYPRAVALACAVNLPNAVLVHFEGEQAHLVLVRDGVPEFVHQVSWSGEASSPQLVTHRLRQGLAQVEGYRRTTDLTGETSPLPVLLLGEAPGPELSLELLQDRLEGREFLPFAPDLSYPVDFPVAEYPANLGLVLADQFRKAEPGSLPVCRGITVNLLPERYLPRPLPVKPVAVSLAFILLGLLAFGLLTPQVSAAESHTDTLSRRLTNLERAERLQRLSAGQLNKQEEEVENLSKQAEDLDSHRTQQRLGTQLLLSRMRAITDEALPRSVRPTGLTRHNQGFTVNGSAFTYQDVIQYKTNLLDSGYFSEVQIQTFQAQSGSGVAFQLNVLTAATPVETAAEETGE